MADDPATEARDRNVRVVAMYEQGRFMEAKEPAEEALEFARETLGPRHAEVAAALNNLAVRHRFVGDYLSAEPMLEEALEILRDTLGPAHPNVGKGLNNLAGLRSDLGDYPVARSLFDRALEIEREALGPRHPEVATTLNNLGELHRQAGDAAAAERCYREALEIYRAEVGPRHPNVASVLNNLGLLLVTIGDTESAKEVLEEARDIRRDAFGPEHPSMAAALNSLAAVYRKGPDRPKATPLLEEALGIVRTALGPRHPTTAKALTNLALHRYTLGDYGDARELLEEALGIWQDVVGLDHPMAAVTLHNLAGLHHAMGANEAAEPLLRQVLDIRRRTLSPAHWEVAAALGNLAVLCAATDRSEEALQLLLEAQGIQDHLLADVFSIGSERQRLSFLETVRGQTDAMLSLVLRDFSDDPEHVGAALDLVLRRKAVSAEAFAAQRDVIVAGRHPELARDLRELTELRMQIAQKGLAGPGPEGAEEYGRMLAGWERQKEVLEGRLAASIPEVGLEERLREAGREAVAAALPQDSVLVEFVRFRPFDFGAVPARLEPWWQAPRYLAFVLPAGEPDGVRMVDLGGAGPIDELIARYRESIVGQGRDRAAGGTETAAVGPRTAERTAGTTLREAVFDPLVDVLDGRTRLLLAPDGDLTRLPLEVLPSSEGGRLIETHVFSYVTSGRDVLRWDLAGGESGEELVAAAPDFDLTGAASEPAAPGRLPSADIHFDRLQGTVAEGRGIGETLGVTPLLGAAVLEAVLKTTRSPRILHIATHGFFLPDPGDDGPGLGSGSQGTPEIGPLRGRAMTNPLLRSGLALAGANTFLSGGSLPPAAEDGILTAEDVSGLDLLGTELVVLSACETGLGEVRLGEGVFGLRRAFVLAGARTLVMSLWKVPDEPSAELMRSFYANLGKGMGRAEALRDAQLTVAAVYPPPWFWGAFICQGDPGPVGRDRTGGRAGKRPRAKTGSRKSQADKDAARAEPMAEKEPTAKEAAPVAKPPGAEHPRSLRDILARTDLNPVEGPNGALGFPFSQMRTRSLVVQALEPGEGMALFAVELPGLPDGQQREQALLTLLGVTFATSYSRAILQAGAPWLLAEIPLGVLTPPVASGLVRGLAVLADLDGSELANPDSWTQAVGGCLHEQKTSFRIDTAKAGSAIREVLAASGARTLDVGEDAILAALGVTGSDPDVFILWDERVISLMLRVGTPPAGRIQHLERLLTLNGETSVAKVGFEGEGELAVTYEVPWVTADVLDHARVQLVGLLQRVLAVFAGG